MQQTGMLFKKIKKAFPRAEPGIVQYLPFLLQQEMRRKDPAEFFPFPVRVVQVFQLAFMNPNQDTGLHCLQTEM